MLVPGIEGGLSELPELLAGHTAGVETPVLDRTDTDWDGCADVASGAPATEARLAIMLVVVCWSGGRGATDLADCAVVVV